jgi:hypothetical protein
MVRKEKRYEYSEAPTLLWLLAASVISASLAIVGFVVQNYTFKIGVFALAIILLCVVFSVFVVAIVAPYIAELLLNTNLVDKSDGNMEAKFDHKIIVRDSESLEE